MDLTIPSTIGDDDSFAELRRQAIADAEDECAEELADQARAEGKTNVGHDEIDTRTDSPDIQLDAERIPRLANAKISRMNWPAPPGCSLPTA